MGSRGDPAGPSRISSRYRRRCILAREQRVEICDRTCSCRRRRVDCGCSLVAAVASMGSTQGALPIGQAFDGRALVLTSVVRPDLGVEDFSILCRLPWDLDDYVLAINNGKPERLLISSSLPSQAFGFSLLGSSMTIQSQRRLRSKSSLPEQPSSARLQSIGDILPLLAEVNA